MDLHQIKQLALKNRVWYVATVVFCSLAVVSVMLFYPVKADIDTSPFKQSEKERKALELQSIALQQLIIQQTKRIDGLMQQDSVILGQSLKNFQAINEIKYKSNEKIKSFASYNSNDWAVYYSNLPDPE